MVTEEEGLAGISLGQKHSENCKQTTKLPRQKEY
jgi:hypothetical protein